MEEFAQNRDEARVRLSGRARDDRKPRNDDRMAG